MTGIYILGLLSGLGLGIVATITCFIWNSHKETHYLNKKYHEKRRK